jgi:hypothetical protein
MKVGRCVVGVDVRGASFGSVGAYEDDASILFLWPGRARLSARESGTHVPYV